MATDDVEVQMIVVYDDVEALGSATLLKVPSDGDLEQWTWSYDWQPERKGVHELRAKATDGAGNEDEAVVHVSVGDIWYRDADNDGTGDTNAQITSAEQPGGYVAVSGDCDDNSPLIYPGALDLPELAFVDSNCDGIDGDEDLAIFVSVLGNDSDAGTRAAPMASLAAGRAAAQESGLQQIYATSGVYSQSGGLKLVTGVSIFGGYHPVDWTRSEGNETQLTGTTQAVLADGAANITLQLLTLTGEAGVDQSVYGLRAINGSALTLERLTITSADALDGAAGLPGSDGQSGERGVDGFTWTCHSDNYIPGGSGGSGPGHAGGAGGGGRFAWHGEAGSAGSGPAGGAGGDGGSAGGGGVAAENGGPGKDGLAGAVGADGLGSTDIMTGTGVEWLGEDGGAGAAGQSGSGGGGGGGGGGMDATFTADYTGNPGGGGGAGGAGATGGSGGRAGGGSFGLYVYNSEVSFAGISSSITTGSGGSGGAGAPGGQGGAGGVGGQGGGACSQVGRGGTGGAGGAGGAGGTGGGGAGGPSIGIALVGSSTAEGAESLEYTIGAAGTGGAGANSGSNGVKGHIISY